VQREPEVLMEPAPAGSGSGPDPRATQFLSFG